MQLPSLFVTVPLYLKTTSSGVVALAFGLLNVVVGESHLVSLYFHHSTEPSRDGKSVMTVMGVGLKRDVFSFVFALSLNSFSYNGFPNICLKACTGYA